VSASTGIELSPMPVITTSISRERRRPIANQSAVADNGNLELSTDLRREKFRCHGLQNGG
jgi:hypothetical protein